MNDLNLSRFSKDQIEESIQNAITFFSSIPEIDMKRLDRQIHVTRQILEEFRQGKKIAIIDAPTGFGKSILGFFIHFALQSLSEMEGLEKTDFEDETYSSYILTSNKFLQEQYLRDILNFKFNEIKMLKGQSNYLCTLDKVTPFPKASCSDQSVKDLMKDGAGGKFPCAASCPYLIARYEAIHAESTILNYAYFLSTMNYVTALLGPAAPFPERALTIYDECHVIGNIVSDAFSLVFNPAKFIREVRTASSVIATQTPNKALFEKYKTYTFWADIDKQLQTLSTSDDATSIQDTITALIASLLQIINDFTPIISAIIALKEEYPDLELNDYQKYMMDFSKTIITPYSSLKMQAQVYEKIGFNSAVISTTPPDPKKNPNYLSNEDTTFSKVVDMEFKFECTNESEMVKKYALSFSNYSIFMSATIGKPQDFARRLELEPGTFACFEVESDFDYTKSPIMKVLPMISMSHKDKDANMPSMMKRILDVVNHNTGVRGLIHTGNFAIMNQIKELNHPRILTYSNSFEKENIIKLLESKPDAIVAGPSLIEGIDLKDDLCRFMIYAKVPYLSLASKLVKKKMELYEGWYNFQTLISFQQGLGRPIRNNKDWCKTYLLDKSFESFFGRSPLPKIIADRLVETNIDSLDVINASADDEFEMMLKNMEM